MLYQLANHLSTLGERDSEESESEESENEESKCGEGDESEFEPLAKRTCSIKKWASCIKFHTLVLYQHFVEIKL